MNRRNKLLFLAAVLMMSAVIMAVLFFVVGVIPLEGPVKLAVAAAIGADVLLAGVFAFLGITAR